MQEQPNYYAIIPANVRYDNNLKDKAKLLYGEITSLSNKCGFCYASNKYFADLYQVELETISRLISSLEKNGYIERKIIYKEGTKEIEKRILIPIDKKVNTYCQKNQGGYCQKNQGGIDQKVKENNTSINNTRINNIIVVVEENFGRTLSPIEYEQILEWEDNELTEYAVKQSVLRGVRNIKYINSILNEYKAKGIKTIYEAQEEEKKYKNKNKKREYKSAIDRFNEVLDNISEEDLK